MELEVITREPDHRQFETPLLFVHGAWHGAWCWEEHFLPYFAEKGYQVHALSLRGHGQSEGRERLRWTRAKDYLADIHQVASQLATPPIIIGHSMGGYLVQKYLEAYPVTAVVLLAPVPAKGVLRTSLNVARRYPIRFLQLNLSLSLRPLVGTEAMAKELLFSADFPREKLQRYFSQLQDESYLGFLDMLFLNLPRPKKVKQTPMLVLGGSDDALFTVKEFQATAAAYGGECEIFSGMAHDMMLEGDWELVARRTAEWIEPFAGKR